MFRNSLEILEFANQYSYPQILLGMPFHTSFRLLILHYTGDFNCIPNATAIQFFTGKHELEGKTGNFRDAWVDYTSQLAQQCDALGSECTRKCTRTTPNSTCWEEFGYTFNALDDAPRKRIDFMLVCRFFFRQPL